MKRPVAGLLLTVGLAAVALSLCHAAAPQAAIVRAGVKPSTYAPAADLISFLEFYRGRLDEALATKDGYEGAMESRTRKDASSVAAIALVLSLHDEQHPLKASAPALVTAAGKLAAAGEDYDAAVKAYADVKKALAGEATATAQAGWTNVADLAQLMKQVPLVHTNLKRGVTDARRFKRDAPQSIGQAAALAAIAQASMFNTSEIKDAAKLAQWQELCADMRDAAGAVGVAVKAGNQPGAAAALDKMTVSCDKCHAQFR